MAVSYRVEDIPVRLNGAPARTVFCDGNKVQMEILHPDALGVRVTWWPTGAEEWTSAVTCSRYGIHATPYGSWVIPLPE